MFFNPSNDLHACYGLHYKNVWDVFLIRAMSAKTNNLYDIKWFMMSLVRVLVAKYQYEKYYENDFLHTAQEEAPLSFRAKA